MKESGYNQYRAMFYQVDDNKRCKSIHSRMLRATSIMHAFNVTYQDAIYLDCIGLVHFTIQRVVVGKSYGPRYDADRIVYKPK
jgi:hypothetical protein